MESFCDAMRYAELHCKTNFSFLEGASHPDELIGQAAALGYAALAITDRNSLAGIVRAHGAAKDCGLKLLAGAETTPVDAPAVVLWATDRAAYGRLCRLLTCGRRRAPKGECQLTQADVAEFADGLLAGVLCNDPARADHRQLAAYADIFGDRGYLLAELHRGPDDELKLQRLQRLSRQTRLPLATAGDVHYHAPSRMVLQHVLTAIRHRTTVAAADGARLFPNAERHLRSLGDIQLAFAQAPDALRRTGEIADRCSFSLSELRSEYPAELAPPGETPMAYLRRLAWEGAADRYAGNVPEKVRGLLEHELALIEQLQYEAFFLTVYDLVRFARSRNILCQGRGSAANSAVCYALGVTAVDPSQHEMLFERFISAERNEAPDIDVDFEHERREEVLQYLYEKYGRERAGLAATVITYRARSAIRDVGKALGLSLDLVDALAKQVDGHSREPQLAERLRDVGVAPTSDIGRRFVYCVHELLGFPRHLSQHVGGMVITQRPLCELTPIENAAMPDRTVIEWDKDDLDELKILKVDCLSLGMLTAIRKCFALIEESTGQRLSIDAVPDEDQAVYEMISRADTIGVFQIESRAQMSMLPRLKPATFYDLVIEVAIVRPGPIQGNMVHPYLRRRSGEESVDYPSPEVEHVLRRTLGVPLFQEQAMQLAVVAAGFTPGEADQLRRAMAAWRRPGLIDDYRAKLINGMLAKGYALQFAERLFEQIRGFGEYGFPESHAASFAKLAYVSSWLKHYYPAAFAAALVNSQPMGFYAPAQLIRDARDHGVTVLPVDVNHSAWDCTLEPELRLGLRMVRGLSQSVASTFVKARAAGPFLSVGDVTRRARLPRAVVKRLADADAFGSLRTSRRQALWIALAQDKTARAQPLFEAAGLDDDADEELFAALPRMDGRQEVFADYQTTGLSLRQHPIAFYRQELDRLGVTPHARLAERANGELVRVAGLVLMRQRPGTAKGITFVTLEDETGAANLIIHQRTWDRYRRVARRTPAWLAHGELQSTHSVIHIVVTRLEALPERLAELHTKSRDFR